MATRISIVVIILALLGGVVYWMGHKPATAPTTVIGDTPATEKTTDIEGLPPMPAPADKAPNEVTGNVPSGPASEQPIATNAADAAAKAAAAIAAAQANAPALPTADGLAAAPAEDAATKAAPAADDTANAENAVPAAEAPATDETAAASAEATPAAPVDAAPATPADTAAPGSNSLLAAPETMNLDIQKLMKDRVLGNPDAPVTIVEYASMTCPHCAHFTNDILPDVKAKLIDTGKAKLIFREFPLDKTALQAALMARCAPEDKFFNLIEVIFRNQERWTKADDQVKSLKQLGTLTGMDDALMDTCMSSSSLENAVLEGQTEAQTRFNINSTPTFILNEGAITLSGAQPVEKFEEAVNKLSAGK